MMQQQNLNLHLLTGVIGLIVVVVGQVNGQTEKNSFQYCFNQNVALLHVLPYVPIPEETNYNYGIFFHPNLTIINATDMNNNPAWNTMARNLCNFLHEKTGNWTSISGEGGGAYGPEFMLRYWDTLPENLKEFIIDAVTFKEEFQNESK